MLRYAAFACLLALVYSDCKPPDEDFHATLCADKQSLDVDPSSIGITPYPPKVTSVLNLTFSYNNPGADVPRFDLVIPSAQYFGSILGNCGWHALPSFLFPVSIKCEDLGSNICDTPPGKQTRSSAIDLTSSVLAKLLSLIGGDKYYGMELQFKNGDDLMACVNIKTFLAK